MKKLFYIVFLVVFISKINAQNTITFSLHCSENEIKVEEDLQHQLDSIYHKIGFKDSTKVTIINKVIVFGHTDNKGSKKANQLLSEKRAEYVANIIEKHGIEEDDLVIGFGETRPLSDNKTEEGRAKNRRVEVTLTYSQTKFVKPPKIKDGIRDTLIVFEDSTRLLINLADYELIKNSIVYKRNNSLFELFEHLSENDTYDTFYNFGSVTFTWDSIKGVKCLKNAITLSVKIPDVLVSESAKELKAYAKKFKGQLVKLVKHPDGKWYIDVITYCPFHFIPCGFRSKHKEQGKLKKVKYVSKNGYEIIGAFISHGQMFSYKKLKASKRKVKFKVVCPESLPVVSIVAVNKTGLDTIFYATGTEEEIAFRRRCFNCIDKDTVVRKIVGIKIHKRLLRRKYIFKKPDFGTYMIRKIKK